MTDTIFDVPPGASVWEQDMLRHLRDHMTREGAILAEYESAAVHSESKALRYVMRILLEDEKRHHEWFRELASSVRTGPSLTGEESPIPDLDLHRYASPEIDALVERLIENEKDDARELKHLRKELRDMEDTTLWALVIQLMERDTEKHLQILRFVKQHSGPLR